MDLEHLGIAPGPEHPCPYLAGRTARERAFLADALPPGIYLKLMDHGWRRSGNIIYRPACEGCAECRPIRVPVARFVPGRTQRKLLHRNADLIPAEGMPHADDERFALFVRYQQSRHSGEMCTIWDDFVQFLYQSPLRTREVTFRHDGRLVASAIIDIEPSAVSSVYSYFDPDLPRRSLGTWMILWLIDYTRRSGMEYYYLGYHVAGCRKMNYKDRFQPCEIGDGASHWQAGPQPTATIGD
ncbi:arginyltransferase [Candidatus Poribacteria bacterium]|nr:arginyltransferase [Candidatus Poribacteria bacterium]